MFRVIHKGSDGSVKCVRETDAFNTDEARSIVAGLTCDDGDGVRLEVDLPDDIVEKMKELAEKSGRNPDAIDKATVLFDGAPAEAVERLEKGTITSDRLVDEVHRFVRFLLSHSTVRGIMVSLVWEDKSAKDGVLVHGFAETSHLATRGDYIRLDATNAANRDEFAKAVGLGRVEGCADGEGGIIIPDRETVESLG